MRKFSLLLFFIIFFFVNSNARENIKIIESNSENLIIQFELNDFDISTNNEFTFLRVLSSTFDRKVGAAQLPVYVFNVGIPPNGELSFSVLEKKISQKKLEFPIVPFPKIVQEDVSETCDWIYEIKPEIYNKSLQPKLIEIYEPQLWRNQQVVKFIIHPFSVKNNQLIFTKKIKLTINFSGDTHSKIEFRDKHFKNVFKNSIINFDIAKYWSIERKEKDISNPFSNADRWFKIPITQDGIYKITKSQLESAGIDVENLEPTEIKIFNGSGCALESEYSGTTPDLVKIPVFLSTGNSFPLYFYARDTNGFEMNQEYSQYFNPYESENIYWLTYNYEGEKKSKTNKKFQSDNTKGKSLTSYHFTQHFEEENLRTNADGIEWFWKNLSSNYEFSVSNLVADSLQKITLKFDSKLYSATIKVNNEIQNFDSGNSVYLEGNFLKNGNNTIDISSSSSINIDYFEVEYDKNLSMENDKIMFSLPETDTSYDITISNVQNNELQIFKVYDFYNIMQIEEFTFGNNTVSFTDSIGNSDTKYFAVCENGYFVPSEITENLAPEVYYNGYEQSSFYLRNTSEFENIDLILICPDEFFEKSKELADLHSEIDSMTVLVVKLQNVYDEFSWGLKDVAAIRNFLRFSKDNYETSYAILVGDGTNDFRNYESVTGNKNKIPPFISGTNTADDYYVFFDGNTPDMMIGRLPCQTQSQLETVVDKIINYVKYPEFGSWRNRMIMLADDVLKGGEYCEPGHTNESDDCTSDTKDIIEINQIYGVEYPLDEFQNKPEVNEDVVESINDGAAIFYYVGHGNSDVLGDEDYFRASRDISRLNNSGKLPFFLAASCNVGHFDSNTSESMAEKMLWNNNGGSIASFAHSREGGYGTCTEICILLVNNLADKIRIGEAIIEAKGGTTRSYEKYTYFGDPTIRLVIPQRKGNFNSDEDSIKVRQTTHFISEIQNQEQYSEIFATVYESDYETTYEYGSDNSLSYTKVGKPIFRGPISCSLDSIFLKFIVPDDVICGDDAHIFAYAVNNEQNEDAIISNNSLVINGNFDADQIKPTSINVWLDRENFQSDEYVSATPIFYADISDSNGINITNTPGHRILLNLDDSYEDINITEKFVYNMDSYTKGSVEYELDYIAQGEHKLTIGVFDNFNDYTKYEVNFKVKKPSKIAAKNVLNYPNPMDDFTTFTFDLDGDADVDIEIFTIAGKMIKRINAENSQSGFNMIKWNGKDADGDRPANGVYFYKICLNSKRMDKTFKLIISH